MLIPQAHGGLWGDGQASLILPAFHSPAIVTGFYDVTLQCATINALWHPLQFSSD